MMAFALCLKGLNHLWQIDDFQLKVGRQIRRNFFVVFFERVDNDFGIDEVALRDLLLGHLSDIDAGFNEIWQIMKRLVLGKVVHLDQVIFYLQALN